MSLMPSPTVFLGLPPLELDSSGAVPALRYGLLMLAALWALVASHGRRWPTLLGGLAFVWVLLGFWIFGFARPYGLLESGPPTREAAYAAHAACGNGPHGFVSGEPFRGGPWAALAVRGVPIDALLVWPSLLPLLSLPLPALLVAALWRRPQATLAATLWLAFSTTDLEALRGTGFVPGLWLHPAASLGVALLLAALLVGPVSGWVGRALALVLALTGLALCRAPIPEALSLPSLPYALLLDPWPWPLLAAFGLRAARDPAARGCLLLGAGCLLASSCGLPLDAWPGFALWRIGLVLAAAEPLSRLLERASALAVQRWPALQARPGLGLALLLLAGLPGAFLTWWPPLKLDPQAYASLHPVPAELVATTDWMRAQLPPCAVVVASPDYASAVAILARRQVLRAPQLLRTADEERRERVESSLFSSGPLGERNASRYGVSHLLLGPGDARRWGFGGELDPPVPGRFRLLFAEPKGFRVYALERWNSAD